MRQQMKALVWTLALLTLFVGFTLEGCRKFKTMTGIGITVEEADPGTPEATVQAVLQAGMERNPDAGWEQYAALIHSSQHNPQSIRNWKQFNYSALRKKVGNYLKDPNKLSFVIKEEKEGEDGTVTLFLESKLSDMPTPCTVQKDNDGSWRLTKCSL